MLIGMKFKFTVRAHRLVLQFPSDPVVRCRCREGREWLRAVALPAEAMNSAEDEVEGVGFRTDSCINGREGRVSRESCRNP